MCAMPVKAGKEERDIVCVCERERIERKKCKRRARIDVRDSKSCERGKGYYASVCGLEREKKTRKKMQN